MSEKMGNWSTNPFTEFVTNIDPDVTDTKRMLRIASQLKIQAWFGKAKLPTYDYSNTYIGFYVLGRITDLNVFWEAVNYE